MVDIEKKKPFRVIELMARIGIEGKNRIGNTPSPSGDRVDGSDWHRGETMPLWVIELMDRMGVEGR